MRFKNFAILWVLMLASYASAHAQLNLAPIILGQAESITTTEDVPVTVPFSALSVLDLNDPYPTGFTMTLQAGTNYTVNGREIIPNPGYHGTLTVPVSVNDGQAESNTFPLTVTVTEIPNVTPEITGQQSLSTNVDVPITLSLADLIVTDPDNTYPDDFTMRVFNGPNYSRDGLTVTPDAGFTGTLNVRVRVDDGEDESENFFVSITVTEPVNVAPEITGQVALSTPHGTSITLKLEDFTVTDPDNAYPGSFTLTVQSGANYTVNGLVVTPAPTFAGELTVPVQVNDGTNDSPVFNAKIEVGANEKPVITAHQPLTTSFETPITLSLANLTVTDDDNYPTGFTMTVYSGDHYTFNGLTITPEAGYSGELIIPVSVNDGEEESDRFNVTVTVSPRPNQKPEITAQATLSTFVGTPITLSLANFTVVDPDNTYPNGFSLKVYPGFGYSFSGTTITPNLLFIGTLTVPVTVNDGSLESDPFEAKIQVTLVPNVAPIITGQSALEVVAGNNITVNFGDLQVTDPDNTYPTGFTMTLYSGANYTFNGTTVTPNAGFSGELTVPVSVNDGRSESARFSLKITVTEPVNVPPTITGQAAVELTEDQSLTLTLSMLTVTDPDNPGYPNGFTLRVLDPASNAHYTVSSGNRITPEKDYDLPLTVPVVVNDGKDDSAPFNLQVTIRPVNDAPVLTGQKVLTTFVTTPITLSIGDLTIRDPDNDADELSIRVVAGANYTFNDLTVSPNPNFKGELKVNVIISDGQANTNAVVNVRVNDAPNVPPVIEGQDPNPFIATQNTPLVIELTKLIVTDPDNKFPTDFTLTVLPGASYTVSGTTITPANNFLGSLNVGVRVSDGTDDSGLFTVNVNVVAPTAKPQIVGSKSLVMDEDGTLTIQLTDLIVTDIDDEYPKGFKLDILNGPGYTFSGTSITPARNLNGFLIISVKVTDGGGTASDPYGLAVLINPVDDAPVITQFETDPLSYEPGADPVAISELFDVEDVDNEYLSFAEIGIQKNVYTRGYDQLLFTNTATIRGVFDADSGKLSLIGYAPISEYRDAVRSVQYYYNLGEDETGKPQALPGNKTLYVLVHDGQLPSEKRTREIIMETAVDLRIPTAFSPNDDTVNETWQVLALSNPQQCENALVRVYDKRGVLLFESIGIENKWDGTYNGVLLPTDTYYYTVDLNLSYAKRTYRGSVVLVR